MTRPTVVLHPRHPPGVDDALRILEIDLVTPPAAEIPGYLAADGILLTWIWEEAFLDGLRWLQSISAGHDQYPVNVFSQRGVVLTSASGVHAPQVAEHAFGLLLSLTRAIGASTRNATRAEWKPMMGYELSGATLGVLGLGAIGAEIARRGAAWGMAVIGTKRSRDHPGVASEVFPPERTAEVFRLADAVISVLPGGAETDGIVTGSMLESLGGWFVNVGRGNVVSSEDIVAALDSGGLLGAGLDVFETEPLPEDSPLWHHPRVVLTPHMAGLSPGYGPRLVEIFAHNLEAFAGRAAWRNRIV